MAWRIHDNVTRGEIDNRERGMVRGRIWLHGRKNPVLLELKGNACPDLAGCLLTFENVGKTHPLSPRSHFNKVQRGSIGDLTASRKVRVPDVPIEEFIELRKKGEPAPEHLANSLYLEWFSEANGRVVIESTDCRLTISAPVWKLAPEEERQRQQQAAQGFAGFMKRLNQALEAAKHEPPEDKEWDEFDYEKFMRESDARTDKYMELFDRYQDDPDRDRIIAREMGWSWLEEAIDERERSEDWRPTEPFDFDDVGEDEDFDVAEESSRADAETAGTELEPDPATEGVDWVRTDDGEVSHPLSLRAFNSSVGLWQECDQLGLARSPDPDLSTLLSEFQITSAKLAGALDSLAYGRDTNDGAFIVAYLKRALSHLHAAQAALESVAPKKILSAKTISTTCGELFAIREEILHLMQEFRRQK